MFSKPGNTPADRDRYFTKTGQWSVKSVSKIPLSKHKNQFIQMCSKHEGSYDALLVKNVVLVLEGHNERRAVNFKTGQYCLTH